MILKHLGPVREVHLPPTCNMIHHPVGASAVYHTDVKNALFELLFDHVPDKLES